MKQLIINITTIIIVVVLVLIAWNFISNKFLSNDNVSNKHFDKSQTLQNIKLDSIKEIVTETRFDVKRIDSSNIIMLANDKILFDNQDSLKKGQTIIYSAVLENNNTPNKNLFKNILSW